jgi:hypothetical protein
MCFRSHVGVAHWEPAWLREMHRHVRQENTNKHHHIKESERGSVDVAIFAAHDTKMEVVFSVRFRHISIFRLDPVDSSRFSTGYSQFLSTGDMQHQASPFYNMLHLASSHQKEGLSTQQ